MRVVYMGTPDFAVPALEKLIDAGHEVAAVVTQPDRRGNRGKMQMSAVKTAALAHEIEVLQPLKIRGDEEFMAKLEELAPEMIVVAAFGQILPKSVLDMPKYGCINIHGSLLPELRGAAPMQYAILEGKKETGVTIMKMDVGLDTGDMISKAVVEIGHKDIEVLGEELAQAGADLLIDTMTSIENGTAKYEKQDDSNSSYAHMIKKDDGLTEFRGTAAEEDCRIRALKGWPNAWSWLGDKTVKFYEAEVAEGVEANGEPGTVRDINKNDFIVNCGEGCLRILELQLQGKKRLKTGDFLRGCKLEKGMKFTLNEATQEV